MSRPPLDDLVQVRTQPDGTRSLVSLQAFSPGDTISPFHPRATYSAPSRFTIQVSADRHIDLLPLPLECSNHSCEPNAAFDVERMLFVAVAAIRPGDEIRCFYPATEWSMDEPFRCNCGVATCLGEIRGAREIGRERMAGRPCVAPHIREALAIAVAA